MNKSITTTISAPIPAPIRRPLLATALLLLTAVTPARGEGAGPQVVIDPELLHRQMTQDNRQIEQWGVENQHKLKIVEELGHSRELAEHNSAMEHKDGWNALEEVREDTLIMLHASSNLWEEYGGVSKFLSAYQKAQSWDRCFASGRCTFRENLSYLDEKTVDFATRAYTNAMQMQQKLLDDINRIEELNLEARDAEGYGSALDVLNKINAQVSDQLLNLNQELAVLVGLMSSTVANTYHERIRDDSARRAFFQDQGPLNTSHIDMTRVEK